MIVFAMPSFLNELAKAQPIPGGGGAAAQAALTGLALLTKIIALETGRAGWSPDQGKVWRRIGLRARELKQALLRLRRQDGRAYLDWKKERGSPNEEDHARTMTEVPGQILARSNEVLELVAQVQAMAKKHLQPDLAAVAELLRGAGLAAARIGSANLSHINDARVRDRLERDLRDQSLKISMAGRSTRRTPSAKR
jgi:formiminotetrahydrofolate cyclodeaminase